MRRKVKGRKRHVVTDTSGLLVGVVVHPAEIRIAMGPGLSSKPSTTCFLGCSICLPTASINGTNLRQALAKFGVTGVTGFHLLPRRWVVERTLAWLNRNRRPAKDFETSITSATTWIYIASTQLLIRRLADA